MGQEFVLFQARGEGLGLPAEQPRLCASLVFHRKCLFCQLVHKRKRVVFADPEPAAPRRSVYIAHLSHCALLPGFTRVVKFGFKPGESVKAQQ